MSISTSVTAAAAKPAAAQTIYLVRVTTKNGSYSVGWDDPKRVLQAIAEFHESGFGEVGVYDLDGRKIALETIRTLAGPCCS